MEIKYLWPIKTGETFFDVWSIPHITFWIFIGSALWPFLRLLPWAERAWYVAACLVVALAWEVFEHYMVPLRPDMWLHGESFVNSWVSDPLTCVVGVVWMMWMLDKYVG